MSNQDFFAASVNARRAALQREARASRVARLALRAGRRKASAADGHGRAHAVARHTAHPLNATAVCGS